LAFIELHFLPNYHKLFVINVKKRTNFGCAISAHLQVYPANILPSKLKWYEVKKKTFGYGLPFDYGSVMNYTSETFRGFVITMGQIFSLF
jgi:hypothetical protein